MDPALSNPYESPTVDAVTRASRPSVPVWKDKPIQFEGVLPLEDYREFLLLRGRPFGVNNRSRASDARIILAMSLITVLGFSVALAVYREFDDHLLAGILVGFIPVLLICLLLRQRLMLARLHREQVGIFRPTKWCITDEGVHTHCEGIGADYAWGAFENYKLGEGLLVLYLANTDAAVLIPRSMLNDEVVWRRLTENVQRQLPGR